MHYISGDSYEASIDPYGNNTMVHFYVSAVDASYNENLGLSDNYGDYYSINILFFEPKQELALTPTPEPSPEPEPKIGIPGYSINSLFVGLLIVFILGAIRD